MGYLYVYMKLLDIILEEEDLSEQPAGKTKEEFLKDMKEKFPYRGGCRYTFPNQESFPRRSIITVHCKEHNIDFPVQVQSLLSGEIGSNGCGTCKERIRLEIHKRILTDFYDSAEELWSDKNGNPLYIYDKPGLRRYTGSKNEFDFYCPKIGADGKPHGKQTVLSSSHIHSNKRHPLVGCKNCKKEQGIIRNNKPVNLPRNEFIKKVKEKIKEYKIPVSWYDFKNLIYTSPHKNGKIKCIKHNEEVFRVRADSFYFGIPLCSECSIIAINKKNFVDILKKYYKNQFVLLSDFISVSSPVILGCTLHGKKPYEFEYKYPYNIKKKIGKTKLRCAECDRIKNLKNFKLGVEEKHGDKYSYPNIDKEYINSVTKIPIVCHKKRSDGREHGMFWQEPSSHTQGRGCPKCHESKNEIYIDKLLTIKRIKFYREKKFSETGHLEYDFYLPKPYNVIIEYDGIQHFEPTFGNSDYTRQFTYNETYATDNIKNDFVKSNKYGLGMIRIPYTLKEGQYDELLMNALGDVKKRKIKFINYPERETPKEAIHPKKINESKLSLMGVLEQIL